MPERLDVPKTHKLFINGQFPRSESGRSMPVRDARGRVRAHAVHASRKDLRDAVEAARAAQGKWAAMTAYNRGQVIYRMAEMMEGKRGEFADALRVTKAAARGASSSPAAARAARPQGVEAEVAAAIDRLVCYAGWADKHAQVLGCNNPVAGPYYNFTIPEPTGVVAAVAPEAPALLGLISVIAPPLCAGNTVVAVTSEANPLPGLMLGEVCATSDLPAGVVNLLSGARDELVPWIAGHREIDAVHAAGVSGGHARALREGVAENLKRVTVRGGVDWASDEPDGPGWIEPFVEMKTVWHPVGS